MNTQNKIITTVLHYVHIFCPDLNFNQKKTVTSLMLFLYIIRLSDDQTLQNPNSCCVFYRVSILIFVTFSVIPIFFTLNFLFDIKDLFSYIILNQLHNDRFRFGLIGWLFSQLVWLVDIIFCDIYIKMLHEGFYYYIVGIFIRRFRYAIKQNTVAPEILLVLVNFMF